MYQSVKRFGPLGGRREGPEVVRALSSQDVMTLSSAVQLALDELGEGADVADIERRVGEILTNG